MSPETSPILVLREAIHGMPIEALAADISERLPDHEVRFARTRAEERERIADARIVVGTSIDEELLDAAESLDLFACVFAGYGHLPLSALAERDVAVTSAVGVHATNIAEHVLGVVLAFTRDFFRGRRLQNREEWRSYHTRELAGSTVAVVGLGAIGSAVAERLQGFDVHVTGVRRSPEKGGPADEVFGPDEFEAAIADADYVVLACPLTEETRGLIDRHALTTMPGHCVVVNVARGPVVDTDDLVYALQRNAIGGAALDVTDPEPLPPGHPLWNFENVFITPHNSGHTPHYYERVADILAENVERIEAGGYTGLRNQVLPTGESD
jgi:phosphoglycerate dehydrogenase-like enzyme